MKFNLKNLKSMSGNLKKTYQDIMKALGSGLMNVDEIAYI